MIFLRKVHSKKNCKNNFYLSIPVFLIKQLGISSCDDMMFDFQPGAKQIILAKSSYDKIPGRHRWTKEEIELLKSICKDGITDDVVARFDRTKEAVKSQARVLGLKVKSLRPRPWSDKDKKLFIELFPKKSLKELAEIFGRSIYSIKSYAYSYLKLSCKGKTRWSIEDTEVIKTFYPTAQNKWIAKKLGRSVSEIRAKAYHLGIKKVDADGRTPAAESGMINSSGIQGKRRQQNPK